FVRAFWRANGQIAFGQRARGGRSPPPDESIARPTGRTARLSKSPSGLVRTIRSLCVRVRVRRECIKLPLVVSLVLALAGDPKHVPRVWLFDDFESAEHTAANQLAWIALGDDLFGGASTLALATVPHGKS